MAQSTIYIYRKENNFEQETFGYYQSGFNFCLTIDETKDSAKILVLTRNPNILAPNTIVKLEGINAWWCVKNDTMQRHNSERNYLYEHTIELQGAFEIFNSRDLINCGFNVGHYSVGTFLIRLVSLSNFELPISFDYGTSLSRTKVVDFLKTFENYTLASAIKEVLNGYNCVPKMVFNQNEQNQITSATINIYSKSGLTDTPLEESVFNEVNAVDSIDRESYATKVISNIQNCVGRYPIKYPRISGACLVGDNGTITYDTAGQAKLLLPSKVYAVESITIYGALNIELSSSGHITRYITMTPDDLTRKGEKARDEIVGWLEDYGLSTSTINGFISQWETYFNNIKTRGYRKIRSGGYYDATDGTQHGDYCNINNRFSQTPAYLKVYLNNERYAMNSDNYEHYIISWKQGSNEIKGFDFFQKAQGTFGNNFLTSFISASVSTTFINGDESFTLTIGEDQNGSKLSLIDFRDGEGNNARDYPHCLFSVEYIPMTDIKFKTDNKLGKEDTKLYNQNGKLVDSYAVSKLVNSYCKSIRDKELTRFGTYYDFNDIPKVGARVGNYVINNVSYDVYDNDNGGFLYKCQFSLNLYSACKSIMINANTNIRDYDCPQSNNIKRIQNYRDFVELSYEQVSNIAPYLNKEKLIHIDTDYIGIKDDLVFVMKATDDSFNNQGDNNSNNYYYHLDHISFDLSKQKKFVVDFYDNNIIGYGNAHAYKPFTLSNIFDRDKMVTIPISYVNTSNGELHGIELLASDEENAESNFGDTYISESVAIKYTIYNKFLLNYSLKITEENYDKDGLEIPVFEYSCEINGDDNIEVADNFFEYEENFDEFIAIARDYPITNENEELALISTTLYPINLTIEPYQTRITIRFTGTGLPASAKTNWGIFARKGSSYRFLFALNNYPIEYTQTNDLIVYINNYKLK